MVAVKESVLEIRGLVMEVDLRGLVFLRELWVEERAGALALVMENEVFYATPRMALSMYPFQGVLCL